MKSTTFRVASPAGVNRRVPSWASGLIGSLARDLPSVVTRDDLIERLQWAASDRDVGATVSELRRLGWLVGLPVRGTWAFVPPGQDALTDPYLPLRAWRARDEAAGFMLAGTASAWHLGYLDRPPEGRTQVWLPAGRRLPDGLRPYVGVVKIKWPNDMADRLGPTTALLARRKLDIVRWASGLPAFGPEALIVQLSWRPSSFGPWADLVAHLDQLTADCDDDRLVELLADQSASAWQRAAYLLHAGGHPSRGTALLDHRPRRSMPKALFEHPNLSRDNEGGAIWMAEYHIVDRLVAPLQGVVGKA